jgi:hypothetical protein
MIINTLSEKKTFSDEQISIISNFGLTEEYRQPFKEPFPYRLQLVIASIFSPSKYSEKSDKTIIFLKMGPFKLDWDKPGIASFRPIHLISQIITIIDLNRIISYEDLPQLQKIIKVWNRFYGYSGEFSAEEARNKKSGNSYAFLNTILNILVYKKWWSNRGEIANYLKNVKTQGSGYLILNDKYCHDHIELDQYYLNNKNKLGKEKIELLKAYDRGFRFIQIEEPSTCPFKNIPEREANGTPENYILNTSPENEELSSGDIYNNSKALKNFI